MPRCEIWHRLSRGGKAGFVVGIAASIAGAASIALAVGAMIGGGVAEHMLGTGWAGLGLLIGFILNLAIVLGLGAGIGAAVGSGLERLGTWKDLTRGGKFGCALGVVLATPLAVSAGDRVAGIVSAPWDRSMSLSLMLSITVLLLLVFTLTMDGVLVAGFGLGGALGQLTHVMLDASRRASPDE